MKRPFCQSCNVNPCAVNYKVGTNTYFRSLCSACIRVSKKHKPVPPSWVRSGYKKKPKCDRCGFVASNIKTQLRVFYVDGNLKNNDWSNLKTICLNCQATIPDTKLPWKPAELEADY